MILFEDFFNNRPVFGVDEEITIKDLGKVKAKFDSGNEAYNVLHGIDIKVDEMRERRIGGERFPIVTFKTIDNQEMVNRRVIDTIEIIAGGDTQKRPVISLDIEIEGKEYKSVPFSLADRSKNEEPVLIGAPFIKKLNGLVDVKKSS